MNTPLAITMGCPVGIGPEIILKFFSREEQCHMNSSVVVLGDLGVLSRAASLLNIPVQLVSWQPGSKILPGTIPVFEISQLDVTRLTWGQPDATTALAMADYIRTAALGCLDALFAAMVTCPISKKSLQEAGVSFPGHTEMLADLTGTKRYRMMMAGTRLRVVLVTIHEPLTEVGNLLTLDELNDCIQMTVESLQHDFAIPQPQVAVAGLNPHSGEQGMFGREELDIIEPVIHKYSGAGRVSGPWPPDTVFYKASSGDFDAVIAMYHDQGLIPFKLLHFQDGVNVTLGLPIVRTSVDHGTAYDIAGKGCADAASLQAAVSMAGKIVENRTGKHARE